MRAKGINQMSTRRAVRPDAMVYRQTRRMGRRRRSILVVPAVVVAIVAFIVAILIFWLKHRH